MDSLTQIVIGIVTADLCAGKKLQRKTFLYGAILGTLPDIDVAVGHFMNPVEGMALHRGLSHSLLFATLAGLPLGWLITKLEKGRINFRNAALLVFCCLVTHILIDLFTSWGTQVFWPFNPRIALKTIFVVDPLFTLPLLIAVIAAWKKQHFGLRKIYLVRGLFLSSAYLLLTCALKVYALGQFKRALERKNIAYTDLIVKPTAFNCILWNANVATKDAFYLGDFSVFDTQPAPFKRYSKNSRLSDDLRKNKDFKKLKEISEGWFLITRYNEHYYFNDLRFGLLKNDTQHPQFVFSYVFIQRDGELVAVEVPKQKRDGRALLKNIIKRIRHTN